jgi:hypothetical protein
LIGILILALTIVQFPHIEQTAAGDRFEGYPLLSFDFFYVGVILLLIGIVISVIAIIKKEA